MFTITAVFLLAAVVVLLLKGTAFAAADTTGYLSSYNAVVKLWNDKLQRENWEKNWFLSNHFSAPASGSKGRPDKDVNAPIAIYTDLDKWPKEGDGMGKQGTGDRIRITWRNKPSGSRVVGNGTLRGNEGALSLGYMDVIIDQWRYAVKVVGQMSGKRTVAMRRSEMKMGCIDFVVNQLEEDIWQTIYQKAAGHLISLEHYSSTMHPNLYSYNAKMDSGYTNLPSSSQKFDTTVLDYIARWYDNKANPITMCTGPGGSPMGIVVISDSQWEDLKHDDRFWSLQKDAIKPVITEEEMKKHPLFYKSAGYYDKLCIYHTSRVWDATEVGITGGGTDLHCAVALGARAIGWANGGFGDESIQEDKQGATQFKWVDDAYDDYKNELNQGVHLINGIVRADFTMDATGTKNQSSGVFVTATSGNNTF